MSTSVGELASVGTLAGENALRGSPRARQLCERIESTRAAFVRRQWFAVLSGVAALTVEGLGIVAGADFLYELPWTVRATLLAALLAGGAALIWYAKRHWIESISLDLMAGDIERHIPNFGQRLRTTLDYHEPNRRPAPASPSLLAAVETQTDQLAAQYRWERPVLGLRGLSLPFLLGVALFVAAILVAVQPEMRIAAGRSLLLPWEYTTVTFSPQQTTVRQGESVKIVVEVQGRPITEATLQAMTSSDEASDEPQSTTLELLPVDAPSLASGNDTKSTSSASPVQTTTDTKREAASKTKRLTGKLTARLDNLQNDTTFQVHAGPRILPTGSIRVLQPLTLESFSARIQPPAYTNKEESTSDEPKLSVWEGSNVQFEATLNRAATKLTFHRFDTPPSPTAEDGSTDSAPTGPEVTVTLSDRKLVGSFTDVRRSGTWECQVEAADGITMEPLRIDIRVQLDRRPRIRFVAPPEQLEVTPSTEVPLVIEAEDDLGLHKVGILYQIGDSAPQTLWEEDRQGDREPVHAAPILMLEQFPLTHQDAVTYYAFAEDQYFDQPRRVTTPLRFIDIRPYEREYQFRDGENGESGQSNNGASLTLEELITRQRHNLNGLFQASAANRTDAATRQRWLTAENELRDATSEFAIGIAEQAGPQLTLDEAVMQMTTAVEQLEKESWAEAIDSEKAALTALIRARENLRQLLSNSNSSCSQCRKFDQQQKQKLRPPEKKKDDSKEQLTQTRNQLEQLAREQRKWSEDVQPKSDSASQPPRTPEQLAQAQQEMLKKLDDVQKKLEQQQASSSSVCQQQGQRAGESMRQGLEQLQNQRPEQAAQSGNQAAERLEQLAEHLAAMSTDDLGKKLDQAERLAREIAERQGEVRAQLEKQNADKSNSESGKSTAGKSTAAKSPADTPSTNGEKTGEHNSGDKKTGDKKTGGEKPNEQLARDEQRLADRLEQLREQLANLQAQADTEPGVLGEALRAADAEHPPREIAERLRQVARDLENGRPGQASKEAGTADEQLNALHRALRGIRHDYAQPQLQELMALEEQLAQLAQQLERQQGNGREAREPNEQKLEALAERLERLAKADRRLAESLQKLGQARPSSQPPPPGSELTPAEHQEAPGEKMPEGFFSWKQLGDYQGLREVNKAIQAKIQEAILAGALQDSDDAVPTEYRGLVEKYYKTLSDDLR